MIASIESATPLQRWQQALDELEDFIRLTEQRLDTGQAIEADPWNAPELGPIPTELTERARELVAHQQRVLGRLPAALAKVRQQRSVTARFAQTIQRGHAVPVYIDRTT